MEFETLKFEPIEKTCPLRWPPCLREQCAWFITNHEETVDGILETKGCAVAEMASTASIEIEVDE